MPIPSPIEQERRTLEACLMEAKHLLDRYRETGNEIMVALTEGDIDQMLDRLLSIYKRRVPQ